MTEFTATFEASTEPLAFRMLRQIAEQTPYADAPPVALSLALKQSPLVPDWLGAMSMPADFSLARWAKGGATLGYRRAARQVEVGFSVDSIQWPMSFAPYLGVPFSVCALGSVFFDEWIAADYERWSFSRGHIMHGWGCAFRGAGHDHLVSRRWLDFGPWRTIRLPEDTTFVQFHDLAITDPAEAYEVAKVGHERMGVSYTGGFIQQIDQWMLDDARGAYTAHDRKLHIVVADGVEVPQLRMLNAATLRRHYRLNPGEPEPVERIAFVFVHEGQARAHLHELWLRELECWVHDARGLRRLDVDYHQTPTPPAWVRRLDATADQTG